jgi:asparagine synthetase B (glutamine-hydrolysing)
MLNLRNFFIVSSGSGINNSLHKIDDNLWSNYSPVLHKEHFCFYHGIIHNAADLFTDRPHSFKEIELNLIELFLEKHETLPAMLSGNFSIVIGNKDYIYIFRDGNGYENLYFSLQPESSNQLVISNSVKEVMEYMPLEVNTHILPEYFLKTDVNSGATFFKDFETLIFFEYGKINRDSLTIEKGYYDSFFLDSEIITSLNIDSVIDECDNLIEGLINTKVEQLNGEFRIVNSLSGGTDSSYIQYFLNNNNLSCAYTANFMKTGLDHSYASDIAYLMKLKHVTIQSDAQDLINGMENGILTSEKPFLFAGESLLSRMYSQVGMDSVMPVACFDGTGAEGIFGASRILYELRILRKYRFLSGLMLPFVKIISLKLYNRYREFRKYTDSKIIPDNFVLRYFTNRKIWDEVKSAFNLQDLSHIDSYEMSMMRKYNVSLFEAVYRFLAFELEFRRVNNIRTQVAKSNHVFLVFPFTELSLFKYLIKFDTEIKLRNAKTKYLMRRAMELKFPRKIVYRKKIMKNVSVSDEILGNEKVKVWIDEIKAKNYSYFTFDYDKIFGSPQFATIAYKLINFHIWHKLFIENK